MPFFTCAALLLGWLAHWGPDIGSCYSCLEPSCCDRCIISGSIFRLRFCGYPWIVNFCTRPSSCCRGCSSAWTGRRMYSNGKSSNSDRSAANVLLTMPACVLQIRGRLAMGGDYGVKVWSRVPSYAIMESARAVWSATGSSTSDSVSKEASSVRSTTGVIGGLLAVSRKEFCMLSQKWDSPPIRNC